MEETSRTTSAKKQQRSTPAIRSCRTPKNPRKRSKSRSRPAVKNTAHAKPKAKRLGALAASPKSRSTRCRIAAPDPWERCLHDINGCWRPLKQICNRPKNRRKRLMRSGSRSQKTQVPQGKRMIRMEQVNFSYPNASAPLIQNFNLSLKGPRRMALTGCNGSGKTTLVKLMLGVLQPQSGTVHLGTD